jgi:hypothetical protein
MPWVTDYQEILMYLKHNMSMKQKKPYLISLKTVTTKKIKKTKIKKVKKVSLLKALALP